MYIMPTTRIVSWNVNGIRAIAQKGFFEYLRNEQPDILCVQETKAHPEQLTPELLQPEGYYSYFHSCSTRKGYSGVATFCKTDPMAISRTISIERFDSEGRVLQTDFPNFTLFNVYFPNGSMEEKGRLHYKLDFYDAFFEYCAVEQQKGKKLIICGDFNTAHEERDLARPVENQNTSGFLPQEREKITTLLTNGYTDTFRLFEQNNGFYSWWSFRQNARERNIGWRIDYFLATNDLVPCIIASDIQPTVFGSDHCPVTLTLQF